MVHVETGCRLDLTGSGYGSMPGSSEHGNVLGSHKEGEFLHSLNNYQHFKKDPNSWRTLYSNPLLTMWIKFLQRKGEGLGHGSFFHASEVSHLVHFFIEYIK